MKIKQIVQGWTNDYLDDLGLLSVEIQEIANKRLSVCNNCKVRTDDICDESKADWNNIGMFYRGCGCHLVKKAKSPASECPGDKW